MFNNLWLKIQAKADDSGVIDTSGLKEIIDKVQQNIVTVFGVLLGVIGLAALVYSLLFIIKAGFSSEPEARKKHMKALGWLWGAVLGVAIIWGLSSSIVAMIGAWGI